MLKKWEDLPEFMRCREVEPYYEILKRKRWHIFFKRVFDIMLSVILLIMLSVPLLIIAILVKIDSEGEVFFRQERVTRYGRIFRIHKFRTMVTGADKMGSAVTVENDKRITRLGTILRKFRLDELPQIIDVLNGDMSFVGTRPEVEKYVKNYTKEMFATLLMPAGITSEASIKYKDESNILSNSKNVDAVYVGSILPEKMKYNLGYIRKFSVINDIKIMLDTFFAVIR